MMKRVCCCLFVFLVCAPSVVHSLLEGLYCGKENCYDVLGVTREATTREITKAYRKLAREYHPDSKPGDKDAHDKFILLATAYETLKDDEARTEYDSMLDNPEEVYRHYYRYYRRRAPNVDVRLVIVVTITVISGIQYYAAWYRHNEAISYFATVNKYRNQAMQIAEERGLFDKHKPEKGKSPREQKEELKLYKEAVIKDIVAENMDIQGGYAKPDWQNVLWVQLFLYPYSWALFLKFYMGMLVRYYIQGKPLNREEKLYCIRRNFKVSQSYMDYLSEQQINEYLVKRLYDRECFEKYKALKEEEQRQKDANNAKLKKYKRWIKNHGTGRMTFDD